MSVPPPIFLCSHGDDARPVRREGRLVCELCDGMVETKNQGDENRQSCSTITSEDIAAARRDLATARREANRRFDQLSERLDRLENRHAS